MKPFFYLILFISLNASAQIISKDSVYHLKEVTIGDKKPQKQKIVKVETKGEEMGGEIHPGQSKVNCLNVPDGELKKVTMFFNSGLLNIVKGPLNIEYQDTEFTLLIYDVDAKGKPGKSLISDDIKFIVKKKHKGGLDIDVSALHLKVSGKLCVGLRREDKKTKKDPIALKIEKNKNAKGFSKDKDSPGWYPKGGDWVKMRLKVATE